MKKPILLLLAFTLFAGITLTPTIEHRLEQTKQTKLERQAEETQQAITGKVVAYLQKKGSPLNEDEVSLLVQQKHWKLLVAVSAIESQYCKRQLGYNCWGIGGDSAYRHYENFSEAIIDANNLIDRWQARGRWLTVEDMNCHYVVPCNDNWVRTVNKVLQDMESL